MTPDAKAAADEVLSIDGAAGLLDRARESFLLPRSGGGGAQSAPEGAIDDDDNENSSAATTAEDGSEANAQSDAPGDAEANAEDEAAGNPPLPPPRWWNKDAKARFTELPPELQAVVLQQEDNRERVVQKAKQEAADVRKRAEAHHAEMAQRIAALDALMPQAARLFETRWANVDWSTLPDKVGAEEAFKLKAQFENERDTLMRLAAVQQAAEAESFRNFVAAESERLRSVAPDLADDAQGPERKRALGHFLLDLGFPAERIQYMSADEASIAYDAMRWREAQKKAAALSKKQSAQTSRPPVKPTAGPMRSTQSRSADDALRRLRATGRVDDAVALLNARG